MKGDGTEVWGRRRCASKLLIKDTERLQFKKHILKSERIVHKAHSFPYCPTSSHLISILLL